MPNHVYCNISVEEKYADKLKEIAEVGLAQYYKPMPKELKDTKTRSQGSITIEESDRITELYGHNNWYDWSNANWGTKWGCYDNEYEDGNYYFTTAWNSLDPDILDMLAKDIPNFWYTWEEEQGFGEEIEYTNGKPLRHSGWDMPEWENSKPNDRIYSLRTYYYRIQMENYLADTYEDAEKILSKD